MSTLVDFPLRHVWSALGVARERRLNLAAVSVRRRAARLRSDLMDVGGRGSKGPTVSHQTDLTRRHIQDCLMCS